MGPRAVDQRNPADVLGGLIPHARFTTVLILTINFGLYAATTLFSMRHGNESLFSVDGNTLALFGAKVPRLMFFGGQWWRLVTAGFLHANVLHILMNSWVLFDLGAQIEEIYGTWRLLVIYFVATVCGFAASTLWSPALSIGASAGLFGLIGAMIALGTRYRSSLGSAIRSHYLRWAIYGIVIGLLGLFSMDNAAHIGGLASGFAVAYIAGMPRPAARFQERFWSIAGIVSIALTVLAFVKMFLFFAAHAL